MTGNITIIGNVCADPANPNKKLSYTAPMPIRRTITIRKAAR